ncbi:MAG TPA: formate dehydrogenase accessory sulfurtransferase FdhD [Bacillales bacterium]|nr:formate dehydrogenase accessory sulfurtransferase FdhD [Bacillales bacterium]
MEVRSLTAGKTVTRCHGSEWETLEDEVAVEYPLTVMLNGEEFATIVCTPADLEDMVLGFLASEGVIRFPREIQSLTVDEGRGYAYVEANSKQPVSQDFYMKRMIGSCCGKSRHFYFQNDARTAKTVTSMRQLSAGHCFALMEELQQQSVFFKKTGGVHNAALCTENGIEAIRTDIGRHNALDKLYGYGLKNRVSMADKAVAFSGRISSEVLLKISKIGTGILLSKSAPTDLALNLAEELNITVVGFIRADSMNIYTHSWRIKESE